MSNEETKTVLVSPQWRIIFADLKDLVSDFLWGSAGYGITMLLDYMHAIDLNALFGENAVYGSLLIGFFSTFLTRILKKIKKESNYPVNQI